MLNYHVCGAGPHVVLLLHGFLGSGRNLSSLARRWAERDAALKIILPDLTGHGLSPPLPESPTLETLAGDLLELAASFGEGAPFAVVGHSLGGRVGLTMRHLRPAEVQALGLLDISASPWHGLLGGGLQQVLDRLMLAPQTCHTRQEMRAYFLEGGVSASLTDWILMNLSVEQGSYAWRINRDSLKALHIASGAADLWPWVQEPGGPILLLRGGASNFVSDHDAQKFRTLGVTVETLAGAGHFLHVDAQIALLDHLVGFVRSATRRASL